MTKKTKRPAKKPAANKNPAADMPEGAAKDAAGGVAPASTRQPGKPAAETPSSLPGAESGVGAAAGASAPEKVTASRAPAPAVPPPSKRDLAALVISSKKGTRRRAGIEFGKVPRRIRAGSLSQERREAIWADPMLTVNEEWE